ncbi:photosynthetic complex putative assembly protein PuhB [Paucibacter sp. PLA-PC-4]|uniref:photosynthetic complex putative assembly protein PuhB n=1 Tax=Paucibacter sp. PLA-PC-4 TaxID=2993655 RepID=UPI00224A7A7E|nr:photosynthetic complex putative assembly protein PuhB [Paucibacter sp. PLA-PC-4]MCX2864571.1 photosynthetic complex putative assembly protein PuhB [Paucibacter sp. PLA-PC-4]
MRAVRKNVVDLLTPAHEHEFEAAHGLPEALPAGETQLWQGSPDALLMARQALHLDLLLLYFGALLAWRGLGSWYDGEPLGQTVLAMAGMLPPIVLALGLIGTLAWLMARSTVYTITNRRVVMRVGVVLSITFNLPFAQIASAGFRRRGQAGDIVLSLAGSDRIAYLHLWPHVRPWQLKRTQPMLRALADANAVAQTLARALAQAEAARSALPVRAVGVVDPGSGLPALVAKPMARAA